SSAAALAVPGPDRPGSAAPGRHGGGEGGRPAPPPATPPLARPVDTTSTTPITTVAAATRTWPVSTSPTSSAPSSSAMTGFTYAYVETSEIGAWCSNQMYAGKATSDPNTTRRASASQAFAGTSGTSHGAGSDRATA